MASQLASDTDALQSGARFNLSGGRALIDPCHQCNPWLDSLRREGGDDFFEARIAAQRVPERIQF
jgi:hypothetical protein